ncbi:hypothetical protein SLA2020_174060 [Shorea laevis]
MTTRVSPIVLVAKLQPYLKNGDPQIRAKVSMCFSPSVPQLGVEGIKTCGIDRLIQVAASQLSDQLPESRDAAQTLLLELQTVYKKSCCLLSATVHEHPKLDSWKHFCQSKISPLSTQAVLRVTNTNVAREALLVSS